MQTHINPNTFHKILLNWFDQSGRKDLPWQKNITPYRVWLSEIMLQQTQVTTVINYFKRFTKTYPTLKSLSHANEDDVLALWTGLGYYARARNLLKCAKIITTKHHGCFPNNLETLETLPGIGRSTAGAILSIAFKQHAPILDGNVKRVLTRLYGIKEWAGNKKTHDTLWQIAGTLTPETRTADYTQAIMDLGAMICTRSNPVCAQCPFAKTCIAKLKNITDKIPAKKPKTHKPTKTTTLLIIQNKNGDIYLEKRPSKGLWGGLWSFPECETACSPKNYCSKQWKIKPIQIKEWPEFKHTFTHFHLMITPVLIVISNKMAKSMAPGNAIWYNHEQTKIPLGFATPVKKLLIKLKETQ